MIQDSKKFLTAKAKEKKDDEAQKCGSTGRGGAEASGSLRSGVAPQDAASPAVQDATGVGGGAASGGTPRAGAAPDAQELAPETTRSEEEELLRIARDKASNAAQKEQEAKEAQAAEEAAKAAKDEELLRIARDKASNAAQKEQEAKEAQAAEEASTRTDARDAVEVTLIKGKEHCMGKGVVIVKASGIDEERGTEFDVDCMSDETARDIVEELEAHFPNVTRPGLDAITEQLEGIFAKLQESVDAAVTAAGAARSTDGAAGSVAPGGAFASLDGAALAPPAQAVAPVAAVTPIVPPQHVRAESAPSAITTMSLPAGQAPRAGPGSLPPAIDEVAER